MTIDTLIEILGEYRDRFGGDTEVRLMTQQNWPFENNIYGVTSGAEINDDPDDDDDDEAAENDDVADDAVVYIVEGGQLGYGTKRAWDAARND